MNRAGASAVLAVVVLVGGSVAKCDETLAIAEPVLDSVRIGDGAP